jgi:hypothetical protein
MPKSPLCTCFSMFLSVPWIWFILLTLLWAPHKSYWLYFASLTSKLGCQWREGGWCIPALFLSPMPLWCCGLRCPWGWRTAAAACFWECAIAQAVRTQVYRWLGDLCCSSGTCGWLSHLLLSVRWSGELWCWRLSGPWIRVGNACGLWFIRLVGRDLLCSRPIPKLPPPSGLLCMMKHGMISQSQRRAGMKSALVILSCLFASRFPCALASGCASPISIDGVLFPCFAWRALYFTR